MLEKNYKPQLLLPPHIPQYIISCDIAHPNSYDWTCIMVFREDGQVADYRVLTAKDKDQIHQEIEINEVIGKFKAYYKNVRLVKESPKERRTRAICLSTLYKLPHFLKGTQ